MHGNNYGATGTKNHEKQENKKKLYLSLPLPLREQIMVHKTDAVILNKLSPLLILLVSLYTPVQLSLLVWEVPGVENTTVRWYRYEGHCTVLLETHARIFQQVLYPDWGCS